MKKFLDCISIVGATPSKFHGTKKYISTGAVATTEIDESEVVEVTYEDRPSRANLSAEAGDILFAKMQGTRKTLLLDSETEKNIYSTGFYAVRANPEVITTECLYYLIDSELFLAQKDKNCSGATQKAITNGGMAKIEISVPPLSEQGILVDKLKHLTQLIADKKKQLNLFDEIIKSRFIEMFGDPETNPYGWKQLTVNDVCASIVRGPFGSALKKEFFVPPSDTTYKVYEQKHAIQKSSTIGTYYVTAEKYNELRRFECHSGDILMSCSGTMGELYQLPVGCERGIINQALCKFTLNERILPIAFLAYMRETIGNLETKGSGIQNIAAVSYVKAMPINLPPMRVQEQFAAFVEQVDKSKFYIVQMQILLRLLIRAIQQKTTEVLL
jgi:restriction modification system DNA specificity subunit (fragment)